MGYYIRVRYFRKLPSLKPPNKSCFARSVTMVPPRSKPFIALKVLGCRVRSLGCMVSVSGVVQGLW